MFCYGGIIVLRYLLTFFSILLLVFALLSGCTDKYEENVGSGGGGGSATSDGCETCHLDEELLMAVADTVSDPGGGGSGEG